MIDTRRYQWMIGGIGLVMLVAFSLVLYSHGHHTRPGVPVGRKLPKFVAPLAVGGPNDSANANPVCNPAKPAPGGLNVCSDKPIVLDLFATDGGSCVSSVDAMQQVAVTLADADVTFAAVAAGGSRSATRALIRKHHWTIPIGIDPSGAVGALYDVTICPMIEIADSSGTVKKLLIGARHTTPAAIAAAVRSVFGRS